MINLLPLSAQTKNRAEYAARRSIVALALLVLLSLCAIGLFVPLLLVARTEEAHLAFELAQTRERIKNGEAAGVAEHVHKINARLALLAAAGTTSPKTPSVLFSHLVGLVPAGVELTHISYDRGKDLGAEAAVTIEGVAATREAVLGLAKALGQDSLFSNVNSPISNLVHPSKISFTISAKIPLSP